MIWEHPNTATWIFRDQGKVAATISIKTAPAGNTEAHATVSVDGQPKRKWFVDTEEAKRWCKELLFPVPPTTVAPTTSSPLERLILFLQTNPDTAWEVSKRVRVLSAWYLSADERTWIRSDITKATQVHVFQNAIDLWSWYYLIGQNEIAFEDGFEDTDKAKQACDNYCVQEGWLLSQKES